MTVEICCINYVALYTCLRTKCFTNPMAVFLVCTIAQKLKWTTHATCLEYIFGSGLDTHQYDKDLVY